MSSIKLKIDEDLIVLNSEAKDRYHVIQELGKRALAKEYISPEFITKLLEREEEFPTGLETAYPFAIPHVGGNCTQSFLAVATVSKPVIFNAMDGSGKELGVNTIFLFGITNPEQQVEVLKKFIFAFREEINLRKLQGLQKKAEALSLLKALLGDGLEVGHVLEGTVL